MAVNGLGFPGGVPKTIPYGIDDLDADAGLVAVDVDHDAAQFAANATSIWWDLVGRARHPVARRLMITAD